MVLPSLLNYLHTSVTGFTHWLPKLLIKYRPQQGGYVLFSLTAHLLSPSRKRWVLDLLVFFSQGTLQELWREAIIWSWKTQNSRISWTALSSGKEQILCQCLSHIENMLIFPHSGRQFPICCWVLWCYNCDHTLSSFRMTVKCAFLRLKGEGKAWCRDRKLMSLVIADSAIHCLRENRRWTKKWPARDRKKPWEKLAEYFESQS